MKQPLKLEDIKVYTKAMKIGDWVWQIVEEWKYFEIGRTKSRFYNM